MIRDGEASLPKWGSKTPNCSCAILESSILPAARLGSESGEPETFFRGQRANRALFVFRIIDDVKILGCGSVNLKDARGRIAAVARLVPDSGRDKGNFAGTQAILFPLHDSLNGPLQDDVNVLGLGVVVRRTRSGIDVNQIDVHVDVLRAVGFIH